MHLIPDRLKVQGEDGVSHGVAFTSEVPCSSAGEWRYRSARKTFGTGVRETRAYGPDAAVDGGQSAVAVVNILCVRRGV